MSAPKFGIGEKVAYRGGNTLYAYEVIRVIAPLHSKHITYELLAVVHGGPPTYAEEGQLQKC